MSLYTRLIGLTEPKIPVHAWMAALGEYERGQVTAPQLAAGFGLDAGEQAEAAALVARIVTPPEVVSLGGYTVLTNIGSAYDTGNPGRGLGWARLEQAGITGIELRVRVNKVGTGVQDWQLWNETSAAEILVLSDADVAGLRELVGSVSYPNPLPAGRYSLRVRARSSVAADDPVYFGSNLTITRVGRMTSVELHEVLLLAEDGIAYTDETALKARLGV